MREEIYKCDACGKQKGEANHWYCMAKINGEIHITKFQIGEAKEWADFCGEECLLKMVARNLPK